MSVLMRVGAIGACLCLGGPQEVGCNGLELNGSIGSCIELSCLVQLEHVLSSANSN